MPVPDTGGEEWDRLPEETALGALIGLALDGEYGDVHGIPGVLPREADALSLRVTAASLLDVSYQPLRQNVGLLIVSSSEPPFVRLRVTIGAFEGHGS